MRLDQWVVPDLEIVAAAFAATLRRQGIRAELAFKGSEKRRRELANKAQLPRLSIARRAGGYMVALYAPNSVQPTNQIFENRIFCALTFDYDVERRTRTEEHPPFDAMVKRKIAST